MHSGPKTRLRFSDFSFDLRTGELRKNGLLVRLPPQPSKVLAVLASQAGELVTREELEERVWGAGTVVDFERGLNSCINQIRSALGDSSEKPRYIETLPRRGYRFLAQVETVVRERLFRESDSRQIASLVVLPSKVLATEEDAFLADAIPNTISTYVAQIQGLEIKVPPSSAELQRFGGDLTRIAEVYGVNAFVLSTVTAQAESLVLNVQLVDARSRKLLWSDEFDGTRSNYIELLRAAAEGLRAAVRPETSPVAPAAGVAATSEAELAFQRGLYYSNRFNNLHRSSDFDQAFSAFQRALDLDPSMADAAAEIGWLLEFKSEAGGDPQEAVPQMEAWARRALEINCHNGRAWALLTILEAGQGLHSVCKLLVNGLRAVSSAPRFPRAHVALAFGLGSPRFRLEANRHAARLDPLYVYAPSLASLDLAWMHRTEEALAEVDRALQIEPYAPVVLMIKALVLMREQRLEETSSLLKQLEPMAADGWFNPDWYAVLRHLSILLQGEPLESELALRGLFQVASGQSPILHARAWIEVSIHWLADQGNVSSAGQLLLAFDQSGGALPYDVIRLDPAFQWVLRDSRYEGIVQRSRAEFEDVLRILAEARLRGELPAYLEKPLADLRRDLGS